MWFIYYRTCIFNCTVPLVAGIKDGERANEWRLLIPENIVHVQVNDQYKTMPFIECQFEDSV